ncbi:MAG: chemotaxis protein CheW [Planctomycetota bacterium]|nr:chemotaxis protein CheW [Planctomycetota bacterium]
MTLSTVRNTATRSADAVAPSRREKPKRQFVCFVLAGQELALPIMSVQQIDRPIPIRPIASAPALILGGVQVRGRTIPVLDLARRLGLTGGVASEDQRMLILEVAGRPMAVTIDRLSEILPTEGEVVEATEPSRLAVDPYCVGGVLRVKGRSLLLVDPSHLMDAADIDRLVIPC